MIGVRLFCSYESNLIGSVAKPNGIGTRDGAGDCSVVELGTEGDCMFNLFVVGRKPGFVLF